MFAYEAVWRPFSIAVRTLGTAIAAMIAMTATTTISSISVKPRLPALATRSVLSFMGTSEGIAHDPPPHEEQSQCQGLRRPSGHRRACDELSRCPRLPADCPSGHRRGGSTLRGGAHARSAR